MMCFNNTWYKNGVVIIYGCVVIIDDIRIDVLL